MKLLIVCRHNSAGPAQAQSQQSSPLSHRVQSFSIQVDNSDMTRNTRFQRTAFDLEEGLRICAPSPTALPKPAPRNGDGYRIEAVWNVTAPAKPETAKISDASSGKEESSRAPSLSKLAATVSASPQANPVQDSLGDLLDSDGRVQLHQI